MLLPEGRWISLDRADQPDAAGRSLAEFDALRREQAETAHSNGERQAQQLAIEEEDSRLGRARPQPAREPQPAPVTPPSPSPPVVADAVGARRRLTQPPSNWSSDDDRIHHAHRRHPRGRSARAARSPTAPAAAAPLAPALPKPGRRERCHSQAAALDAVEVETADGRRFEAAVDLALDSGGVRLGAVLLLTGLAHGQEDDRRQGDQSVAEAGVDRPLDTDASGPGFDARRRDELETLIWSLIAELDPVFAMTTAASKIDAPSDGGRLRHLLDVFQVKWLVIKGAEALAGPKERAKTAGFLSELRSAGVNLILCGLDPVAELVALTPALAAGAVHHQTQAYDKADEEAATFARAFL